MEQSFLVLRENEIIRHRFSPWGYKYVDGISILLIINFQGDLKKETLAEPERYIAKDVSINEPSFAKSNFILGYRLHKYKFSKPESWSRVFSIYCFIQFLGVNLRVLYANTLV